MESLTEGWLMISRAGESFPYFYQDKEVAEKIWFKWFHLCLNSSCFFSAQSRAWSWPEEKLDCTAKLLGHKLYFHNLKYLHQQTIESEELEIHVAWRISDYSTHFQAQKTNTSLNDPNPFWTDHLYWWLRWYLNQNCHLKPASVVHYTESTRWES